MSSKLILITGLPGMGKTTLGHYLQQHHGYHHFDREAFGSWPRWQRRLWNKHLQWFLWLMRWRYGKIVITWGFSPRFDLQVIQQLTALGCTLVWHDGDRDLAYKNYLRRGGDNRAAFFVQVFQLDRLKNSGLAAQHFNPFTEQGEFKSLDQQAQEIIELSAQPEVAHKSGF